MNEPEGKKTTICHYLLARTLISKIGFHLIKAKKMILIFQEFFFFQSVFHWNSYIDLMIVAQGPNSQHFISFVTYEWAQKARVFVPKASLR